MITEILLFIIVLLILVGYLVSYRIIKFIIPPLVFSSSDNRAESPGVLSSWKYKFMLLKAYFDNGYSITSYPKWAFAILGIGSAIKGYSLWYLVLGALLYGILCLFIGWIFIKYGFYEAQQEVSNQFNLFVKEIRERKSI